jgi:quinol-cytochrome oxidoreductase complex cytochrome b subunit
VINAEAEGEEIGKEKTLPFFPNYMLDEVIAWYAILAILVVLASVFPVGVEAKANALETPAHIKPEWYFLSVYELLKLVPRLVGVMTPILGMGVVILLPLLDRNPEVRARRRPIAIFLALAILVAMVVLTAWGLQ